MMGKIGTLIGAIVMLPVMLMMGFIMILGGGSEEETAALQNMTTSSGDVSGSSLLGAAIGIATRGGIKQIPPAAVPVLQRLNQKYCPQVTAPMIAAIIVTESNWNGGVVNRDSGAQGYGQFMPGTWAGVGVDGNGDGVRDPYNIDDALESSAKYLCDIYKIVEDRGNAQAPIEDLVWAGYNAGPYHSALREGRVPAISETQTYVKKVRIAIGIYAEGGLNPAGGLPAGAGAAAAGGCPIQQKWRATEAGLQPNALNLLRCGAAVFPEITRYSARTPRPDNPTSDHPSGRAVDFMIPNYKTPAGVAYGDKVAAWAIANQQAFGITYLVWNDRIWFPGKGWQVYDYIGRTRGIGTSAERIKSQTDLQGHRDHVHISTRAGAASLPASTGSAAGQGTGNSGGWVHPLPGARFTSPYGPRALSVSGFHEGVDLARPTGTPIRAACNGPIQTLKNFGGVGMGLMIAQQCGEYRVYYAHLSGRAAGIQVGQTFRAGQVIGYVGSTGRSTGPHLHFEIRVGTNPNSWYSGKSINPVPFMKSQRVTFP